MDAEIPTASTGDIAFLLIIFFMVTATFAATRGLSLGLPERDEGGDPDEPAVLVEVREDGSVTVDCEVRDETATWVYLEPKLENNPRKPIVLYAHDGASYQQLVTVYEWFYRAAEHGHDDANVQILTPDVLEDYVGTFGFDPFLVHCQGN